MSLVFSLNQNTFLDIGAIGPTIILEMVYK